MRIAGRRAQGLFSQVTYCGGYSGEVPPLPIPNREVKLTHADGTDPPVGRVGSRRSSEALSSARLAGLLFLSLRSCGAGAPSACLALRCDASLVSVAPFPLRCDASGEGPGLRRNSPGILSLRFLRSAVDLPVSAAVPQRPPRSAATLRNRVHPSEKFGLNPVPPLSPLRG